MIYVSLTLVLRRQYMQLTEARRRASREQVLWMSTLWSIVNIIALTGKWVLSIQTSPNDQSENADLRKTRANVTFSRMRRKRRWNVVS